MTTQTKSAPRKGGASASKRRTAEFAGVTLKLPAELPATFSFDFAQITAREEAGENASASTYRLVVGVIGEEQFTKVRDGLATKNGKGGSLADLIVAILDAYGTDPGK